MVLINDTNKVRSKVASNTKPEGLTKSINTKTNIEFDNKNLKNISSDIVSAIEILDTSFSEELSLINKSHTKLGNNLNKNFKKVSSELKTINNDIKNLSVPKEIHNFQGKENKISREILDTKDTTKNNKDIRKSQIFYHDEMMDFTSSMKDFFDKNTSTDKRSLLEESVVPMDSQNRFNSREILDTKDTTKNNKDSKGNDQYKYYSEQGQELRHYSNEVAHALQLMDLGFNDITSYTSTLSDIDKIVLDTEIQLNKNVASLSKELSSKDFNIRKNAQQLLELQQQETWTDYQKKIEELHEKEFDEQTTQMREFFDKTQNILEKNDESIRGALLGPLNLITKPFEEFFNFDLGKLAREKLFGGGKNSKKNPNESDVAKIGVAGAGYLYVANTIKDIFGKGKKKKDDFEIGDIFGEGEVSSSLVKSILSPKGIATGGLIASLGATVFNAVQGYFSAEEWGVDKVSAILGGAFGGNGSGITNAFKQAGLGALGGASAGFLVGGPVGALIGGLGGLVLGAVGGYFGGEQVAKDIQNAKDVIFTDTTMKDIQKQNLLEDIDTKVASGELPQNVGDAYKELSASMSTEEFAKLGKKTFESDAGNLADWIIAYGKGSLDTLSNESKIALLDNIFNLQKQDPRSRRELLELYRWIGSTFGHDEGFITDIFKNKEHTYAFLTSLTSLNTGDNSIPELSSSLLNNPKAQIAINTLRNQWKSEGVKTKGISENDIIKSYLKSDIFKGDSPHKVQDAIIQPNGNIIETSPKDTLVALKDIPKSTISLQENQMGLTKSLSKISNNEGIFKRLDTLIKLLRGLSSKDPVKLTLPPMTRQDLDLIMNGGIL